MRWVRISTDGKAHPVIANRTMCGIEVSRAIAIVRPGPDDRCLACDNAWREKGRLERPRAPRPSPDEYRPRFTFEHWEDMGI